MAYKTFTYSKWRHGGWYTNVRYPNGACGCVSNNYEDGKWRIACDDRPFDDRPTFSNREEAAKAEFELVKLLKLLAVLESFVAAFGGNVPDWLQAEYAAAEDAIAEAKGEH